MSRKGVLSVKEIRKLLCYGDSNTYGFDPRVGSDYRYPKEIRWTGRLDAMPDWKVYNCGENGREIPHTAWEYGNLNAVLHRYADANILLIMLGTNDLADIAGVTAEQVAQRMEQMFVMTPYLRHFREEGRRTILVSPVPLTKPFGSYEERITRVSGELGGQYRRLARKLGIEFLDAAGFGIPLLHDGAHFSPEGHELFFREILAYFS